MLSTWSWGVQSSVLSRPWELNQSCLCLTPHTGRDRGQGETASGISTPGLDRSSLPGLVVIERHCPSPGAGGPEKERGALACGSSGCDAGRSLQYLSPCQRCAQSEPRWCPAGKGNTNLTACLSSASAAKYPPMLWDSYTTGSRGQTRRIPCLGRAALDSDLPTV